MSLESEHPIEKFQREGVNSGTLSGGDYRLTPLERSTAFFRGKDISELPQFRLVREIEESVLFRSMNNARQGMSSDATVDELLQFNQVLEQSGFTLSGISNGESYNYMNLVFGAPNISHSEQDSLLGVMRQGNTARARDVPTVEDKYDIERGHQAHELLFRALLPHVHYASARALSLHHEDKSVSIDDLNSVGSLALWNAIGRSAAKEEIGNHSLINYARKLISDAQAKEVAFTVFQFDNVGHVAIVPYLDARGELIEELGRLPLPAEVAQKLEISEEEGVALDRLTRKSSDTLRLREGGGIFSKNTNRVIPERAIVTHEQETPNEGENRSKIIQTEWILEHLLPSHAKALVLRFGLDGGAVHTTSEIARALGMNDTHISTVLNNIKPTLLEISQRIELGTIDYEELRRLHIRSVFALYHYLDIDPPKERVAVLKQDMQRILKEHIRKQRDFDIMVELYGLNDTHYMPPAVDVGDLFALSRSSINAIELRILHSLEDYAAAREHSE